jgi:hypothetical protein
MLGDPSGAVLRMNGAQSGFESRTSNLMSPLKAVADGTSAAVSVFGLLLLQPKVVNASAMTSDVSFD